MKLLIVFAHHAEQNAGEYPFEACAVVTEHGHARDPKWIANQCAFAMRFPNVDAARVFEIDLTQQQVDFIRAQLVGVPTIRVDNMAVQ